MSGDLGPALPEDQFRRLAHETADIVADYLAGIRQDPVVRVMPDTVRRRLKEQELGDDSVSAAQLVQEIREFVLPYPMGNGHPRFFGWINSAPAPVGILAEMLVAAQNPSADVGDIAALHVETAVLEWFKDLMGFPSAAAGILISGGTMATLTGLAAARQWVAESDGWDVRRDGVRPPDGRRLLVYVSEETHSSVRKAVELLGLGSSALRTVEVDDGYRMDPDALARRIERDAELGERPFCVVATAGTVNSGAIDPLARIADICDRHGLWLHIDGAYGAIARTHPRVAPELRGIARADSLSIDPHKWLSVPVECGCALVRDGELLRRTFAYVPPYLHTEEGVGIGGPDFAQYGFQQTRGFRALKLWAVLRHMGLRGLREMIGRHLALARELAALIDDAPDLHMAAPVTLSVVAFRYVPAGATDDPEALNRLNRAIEAEVQNDGRVFLTTTRLRGRLVLRACVLHYDTRSEDLVELVHVVREVGAALAAKGASDPSWPSMEAEGT
ncbi:aminotransferase class I/II-fold pyridoxal phosphate-dependent enzyme [Streptomyces luomodiensis]|uniref:Aminotransferase class I/II-fold pyridoxal phosphate-dependent enzyme n=1 Tax=Streptomyces luomodiensis TaxID=3026192 RepID=A0ABY9V562_9ACTN|nr:aminotransferase class I/II-fold pyridoxal phosphate-dependent enzyme [Streptomyces sp. SCA4-21]WNF00023.1 aminotransferase class I/II-fold pyridoxal phosphate-dependent enzyme [Streptomyces sp. SCA4-21]